MQKLLLKKGNETMELPAELHQFNNLRGFKSFVHRVDLSEFVVFNCMYVLVSDAVPLSII